MVLGKWRRLMNSRWRRCISDVKELCCILETSCAGGRHDMSRPLQVDLWPFEPWKWCPSHVWRGPPLCQFQASLLSTYARCARQTNVRHTSSLNTPYPRGGGIIMDEQNYYQMLLPHLSLSSYSIFSTMHWWMKMFKTFIAGSENYWGVNLLTYFQFLQSV